MVILDCNKVQLDGTVKEVLDTGDLKAKFESFGMHTQRIDGHSVREIRAGNRRGKGDAAKAHMIIADTIKR